MVTNYRNTPEIVIELHVTLVVMRAELSAVYFGNIRPRPPIHAKESFPAS